MAFFQNDRAEDNDDVDELDEDDSNEFHAVEIDSMSGIQKSTDDKDDSFPPTCTLQLCNGHFKPYC